MIARASAGSGSMSAYLWVGVILYFLPTVVALVRHVRHRGSVLVINLFTGWTFIGWVIAMAMAVRSNDRYGRGHNVNPRRGYQPIRSTRTSRSWHNPLTSQRPLWGAVDPAPTQTTRAVYRAPDRDDLPPR